jgi:predicted Zn-dependent protease
VIERAVLVHARGIPNAQAVLRLLNQRYPSGELEVGQLVKVFE